MHNLAERPKPVFSGLIQSMRPSQWTKNLVVLAAFFFALGDRQQRLSPGMFFWALSAAVLFCLVSSAVYIFNDIVDRANDRAHCVKRSRPIASGLVAISAAWTSAAALLTAGLIGSCFMNRGFALAIGAYVVIQMLYTLWLKRVAMVDVFVISLGFVLRAAGGALAVNVEISQWLLICTFLMALFLALCKRRHEKRMTEGSKTAITRPSLLDSDERLIDQLIAVIAGSTIIAYAIYTQWPDTIAKFETNLLSLTIPFVVFGIFRYMHLVYRKNRGDQPEQILLTDTPLMADIALFALSVWWVAIAL